jgi:hypothetical protein
MTLAQARLRARLRRAVEAGLGRNLAAHDDRGGVRLHMSFGLHDGRVQRSSTGTA